MRISTGFCEELPPKSMDDFLQTFQRIPHRILLEFWENFFRNSQRNSSEIVERVFRSSWRTSCGISGFCRELPPELWRILDRIHGDFSAKFPKSLKRMVNSMQNSRKIRSEIHDDFPQECVNNSLHNWRIPSGVPKEFAPEFMKNSLRNRGDNLPKFVENFLWNSWENSARNSYRIFSGVNAKLSRFQSLVLVLVIGSSQQLQSFSSTPQFQLVFISSFQSQLVLNVCSQFVSVSSSISVLAYSLFQLLVLVLSSCSRF